MIRYFFIVLILINSINTFSQKSEAPGYKYSLEIKVGKTSESFKISDPANQLSTRPFQHLVFGGSFAYHLNNRERIKLDYDRLALGTMGISKNHSRPSFFIENVNYHSVSVLYERDFFPAYQKSKLHLFFRAGPSLSIARFPKGWGISQTDGNTNDTLWMIIDTSRTNRPTFLSLNGTIGIKYNVSKRIFMSAFVTQSVNITSNDVTTNNITYKYPGSSGLNRASIRTTGNIRSIGFGLGYKFRKSGKKGE